MRSENWPLVVALVTFQCLAAVRCWGSGVEYNMSEYWLMPPLYEYESIESCLRMNPAGVFCIVKSIVKSDGKSLIWKSIQKYSQYSYQYQHAVLTRGICVQQCEDLMQSLDIQQRSDFLQPKFDVEFKYIINDWLLPNISQYRQQYGKLVNICQNYRLQSKYNLTVYSEIEHCSTNTTLHRNYDFWDILFFTVIISLFIIAFASSVYDAKLTKGNDRIHYRTPLGSKNNCLLTAFSLRRNINRLTIKLTSNQLQQDFRFLEAVRVLVLAAITASHVGIGFGMTTSQNPEVFEKLASRPGLQILLSLLPFQVDVFFAFSGLLLVVYFVQFSQRKPFTWSQFWIGITNRYLRSIPLYALIMLFTVSAYDLLQVSPSAYKIMPMVRTICRDKWWINFLFINNYYRRDEQCLIHTWYLAADFQLFVIGMAIVMVLWKFPGLLKTIATVMISLGTLLPMLNVYFYALDAVILITNKGNAFQLWYDKWYVTSYQATETHCISYFGGMLVGYIYHKVKSGDILLAKSRLYKTLQYVVVPTLVVFCIPAPVFHHNDFSKPSLWMAVYAGLHRLCFATFLVFGLLLLLFAERGSFVGRLRSSKLLENAFYRVLGRLSFAFYLIHMSLLKILFGSHHESQRISFTMGIMVFASVTLIGYSLALLAYILVEKPFDIIFKQLTGSGSRSLVMRGANGSTLDNNPNQVNCNTR